VDEVAAGFFLPFVLFVLWVLDASIVLLRRDARARTLAARDQQMSRSGYLSRQPSGAAKNVITRST